VHRVVLPIIQIGQVTLISSPLHDYRDGTSHIVLAWLAVPRAAASVWRSLRTPGRSSLPREQLGHRNIQGCSQHFKRT
jgi:hypothetical protein